MLAIASVLVIAVVSLLITRVATLAFVLTGMSHEAARFQARSALSGTGFTTGEAENVVNHPVRRRIVMTLMLLGSAGLVTAIASLTVGFANASSAEAYTRLGILLGALLLLLGMSKTRWFNRTFTPLLSRLVSRYTDLEARDYAALLHLGGQWTLGEVAVRDGDWLAGKPLSELDLRAEGIAVLGIERCDGHFFGAPRFDTPTQTGDVLLLYGRRDRLSELDSRPAGDAGDSAHAAAAVAEQHLSAADRAADAESVGSA